MAQTQLYTKKAQVGIKLETTVDTSIAIINTDLILCEVGDTPYTIDGENYRPSTVRGDFLSSDEVPGHAVCKMTFRVPMHGSGATGPTTAPEYGVALQACGFSYDAGPPITYMPVSDFASAGGDPGQSYSLALHESGVVYKMKGAFGNVTFNGNAGEPMFMDFEFTGAYVAAADAALLVPAYDTSVSPTFQGASLTHTFGGLITPKGVSNLTIDMGNIVTPVADVNDAAGIYGARITGRETVGSFDPEMVLTATSVNSAYYTLQRAGTTFSLTTGTVGATAGNIWQMDVARAVLRPIEQVNREGIRVVNLPFAISSAGTDVEGTTADFLLTLT